MSWGDVFLSEGILMPAPKENPYKQKDFKFQDSLVKRFPKPGFVISSLANNRHCAKTYLGLLLDAKQRDDGKLHAVSNSYQFASLASENVQTIRKHVKHLEDLGFVKRVHRPPKTPIDILIHQGVQGPLSYQISTKALLEKMPYLSAGDFWFFVEMLFHWNPSDPFEPLWINRGAKSLRNFYGISQPHILSVLERLQDIDFLRRGAKHKKGYYTVFINPSLFLPRYLFAKPCRDMVA